MEHSFEIEIAKRYGIHPAILLKNIYFWIEKNRANESNFYDGHYWTYNSKKAFAELFPYMNARQIDYALKKLIDEGIIITGNYNKISYDRTLWYAITKKGYSILQNCEMDNTKLSNGINKIVQPIPDSKQDNKTSDNKPYIVYDAKNDFEEYANKLNNKKQNTKRKSTAFQPPTLEEVQEYCKERNSTVDPKQFYEYFTVGEWKDSKGNPVRNWKQKLITWERMNNGHQRVCGESKSDKTDGALYQQNFVIEVNRHREITYDKELYGE